MTTVPGVVQMPAHVALGLGAHGLTPETVRDRLAAIGSDDPERGHALADQLADEALRLIAAGYRDPAVLARDVLVVLDAEFPRWFA